MKTAGALIFFNRPKTLAKVFEKVKKVKPPKLFLIQDGPRNQDDIRKIVECRNIVNEVDWDCEIFFDYAEKNLGCGVRPQSGITNALKIVDKLIILEDDCVPELSFFDYCEELLDRYENDERIAYISGLNHFEEWDFGGASYGFTKMGAIWGWATWRRAWQRYDYTVEGINDLYTKKLLKKNILDADKRISVWEKTNKETTLGTKLSYWDFQWGFVKYAQSQFVIVPKYNQISNIGTGADSTHAISMKERHKKYKDYNHMPTKALEFPLIHPKCMMCDLAYDELVVRCNRGNFFKRIRRFFAEKCKGVLKK